MDPVLAELLARKPHVRRQHFVPQFYLRHFVSPKSKKLEVLVCERGQIRTRPATPRSVCYAPYFYGMKAGTADEAAQLTEIMLEDLENQIAPIIRRNIERILSNSPITPQDKWNLAFLMSMLWIRGPAMREMIRTQREAVQKQLIAMTVALKGEQLLDEIDEELGQVSTTEMRKKVIEFATSGDYELHWNNRSHLLMLGKIPNFASVFASCNWCVYISKSPKKFITSDDPVSVVAGEEAYLFGATFYDRTYYFPLTPEICIVAHGHADPQGKSLVRRTLLPGAESDHLILRINSTTATFATSYAYAQSKQSLLDILDATPNEE